MTDLASALWGPLDAVPSHLSIPDVAEEDTHGAAQAYAAAGWYVLPVEHASKHPGSLLGNGWHHQSSRDVKQIFEWFGGTSDHRGIALHVGRSGGLVFDVDHPENLHPDLAASIAETAPPYQSSRPGGAGRGHYLFAAPPGRLLGNGTGRLGKAWGEVRGQNGVIIVAPSVHQDHEAGAEYRWERTGPVPVLTDRLAAALPDGTPGEDAATPAAVTAFLSEHTSASRPELTDVWLHIFANETAAGASRHDSMVSKLTGAMKEARAGFISAEVANARLRQAFLAAVADPTHKGETRTGSRAEGEWAGLLAWAVSQAQAADLEDVRRRVAEHAPQPLSALLPAPSDPIGVDPETGEIDRPLNLPDSFWTSRPELQHISAAAHATARSRDAVFGVTLARLAALVPPSIKLPAPVGRPGTLDIAVALIGNSGTGKTSSGEVAADLLPITDTDVATLPLGSGEGVIEAYLAMVSEPDPVTGKETKIKRQVNRGVLFSLDEGQALAEMGSRKGTTLMPTIRSAWSGSTLGQANASEDRKRVLQGGAYRFALIAGFQTEYATALLDDAAGGTPQRFVYLSTEDPDVPDAAPPWPGPLDWAPLQHQAGPLPLDANASQEIRTRALKRTRGQEVIESLDAHRDLCRLKVAGLLAILANRLEIDAADWKLAGTVMDVSDRVRASIVTAARHRAQLAEAAATGRATRRAAALDDSAEHRALESMGKAMARHVHRAECGRACTRSCAQRSTKSTHRKLATVDDALAFAAGQGWLDVLADGALKPLGDAP